MVPKVRQTGRNPGSAADSHQDGGPLRIESVSAFERPPHRAVERLAVDRLGIGQRRLAELAPQDVLETTMLADHLRTRSDLAMDRDQDCVRLLPQEVAFEQSIGSGAGADQVVSLEPTLGDDGQGVLEAISQALPFGGEAIVTEALEQVSVVEVDGGFGAAGIVGQAGLESRDIQLYPGIDPDPDGIAVDVEQPVRWDVGLREALSDQPECLAEGSCRTAAGIRPQVGRDRLSRPGSAGQDEQGEQRLGVATRKPDVTAGGRPGVQAAEEVDV